MPSLSCHSFISNSLAPPEIQKLQLAAIACDSLHPNIQYYKTSPQKTLRKKKLQNYELIVGPENLNLHTMMPFKTFSKESDDSWIK